MGGLLKVNYNSIHDGATQQLVAPVQANLIATRAYAVNEEFIYMDKLYKVTTAIASGGTIIFSGGNANCELTNALTDQLDIWSSEVTLAANATSVTFTIPTDSSYGYRLFIDRSTAATPSTDPPKQTGNMDFSTAGQVTIPLSTITAAQAGTKAKLRIYK